MSAKTAYLVEQLLLPFAVTVMLVGSVIGIAVGIGLIASSARTIRVLSSLNRWVSSRKALKPLETPQDVAWVVTRYRRWIGAVFVAAGAYILISLLSLPSLARFQAALRLEVSPLSASAVLLETAFWIFALGSVLVLVTGILMIFFPAILGAIEAHANRWISTRRLVLSADTMYLPLDRLVAAYPRAAGWIIIVVSGIAALGTAPLLVVVR